MTLTEMRQLLNSRGIQLTKSLGQNFLHDAHQLDRIIAAAELKPSDKVLEIGPGLGPLTQRLLKQVGHVLAVEKDQRLVSVLQERFLTTAPGSRHDAATDDTAGGASNAKLELLRDDAFQLLEREKRDWADWKVVSNLPYSVASPILVELCRGERSPELVVVTLQFEVARRLMTGPGSKDYGVLSLLVQRDFEPLHSFKIPAGCFFPQPDVDSACVVLKRRSLPLLSPDLRKPYVRLVKRAFSQRRKMMKNLLRAEWPAEEVEKAMTRLGVDLKVRAEVLTLGQFVELTRLLCASAVGNTAAINRTHHD